MKNKALILHHDYYEVITLLSDEEKGKLLTAVMEYDINCEETEFEDRALLVLFKQIKKSIDTNREHYETTCKKRAENAKRRWEANADENMQLHANADNGNRNTNTNGNTNANRNVNVNENEKTTSPINKRDASSASYEHTDKTPHGEFRNVFLTDEEYTKLKERSADADKRIDSLSAYMKSTGKTYADHYAQLLNWQIYGSATHSDTVKSTGKKPPGERREPTFDVSEFTKKALNLKYVPPTEE